MRAMEIVVRSLLERFEFYMMNMSQDKRTGALIGRGEHEKEQLIDKGEFYDSKRVGRNKINPLEQVRESSAEDKARKRIFSDRH